MPLEPGQQIAHYRVVDKIGEGGMGEVYRAEDSRLGREVAIKVLPEAFVRDGARLARLAREAQLLASVNHPNIAGIHGLEEADGITALALELVEGETLADRIGRGPVPPAEAIPVGLQIAGALEAAHGKGIVHRDLKPANVKFAADGRVKVLDFGLAKALDDDGETQDMTRSPTLSMQATQAGVILGTAAYMSPEQARGQAVDRRADLWALGVVLWEMLTGERLFRGETVSDTLAAVLRADPDWERLPTDTPAPLRRLLRRCLERDPQHRLHDAADARLELQDALAAGDEPAPDARAQRRRRIWPWAAATGLLAVVVLIQAASLFLRAPSRAPIVRFDFSSPEGWIFETPDGAPPVLSPDGSLVALELTRPGEEVLALRHMDSATYQILPVENGTWDPFWSPDGRQLGFFAWSTGKLMIIDTRGGPPVVLADARDGRGATWNEEGVIVFAPDTEGPLYRISAAGGEPRPATTLDAERNEFSHRRPQFLPDGRRFLYMAGSRGRPGGRAVPADGNQPEPGADQEGDIETLVTAWVGSLDGDPPRRLDGSFEGPVQYAPPGVILHVRGGTLLARPFDVRSLAWGGEAMIVETGLVQSRYNLPSFTVSRTGVLAYYSEIEESSERHLVWRDRRGEQLSALVVPDRPGNLDLAPDGRFVAMERGSRFRDKDIWITDLERGTHLRVTFDPDVNENGPVWSPDGRRIAYVRNGAHGRQLLTTAASGEGDEKLVLEQKPWMEVIDWSPDGRLLLYESGDGPEDLRVVPAEGGESMPFTASPFAEHTGRFSPDGRWIAYTSTETGQPEIYVRSWPGAGGKWPVSTAGGRAPRWSRDGTEILFVEPARSDVESSRLMAASVEVDEDGNLRTGTPQVLFEIHTGDYEPSPDGERILVAERLTESKPPSATVVLNWPALLEERD